MVRARTLVVVVVATLALSAAGAGAAALTPAQDQVPVRLGSQGKIGGGNQTASVRLRTICAPGWGAIEAFAYVTQDGHTSSFGYFSPTCDGASHTYTITVEAIDSSFHEGEATGTAYVLLMGPNGQTRSGGDTRPVTLTT
jgi:hypothetical protein